MALFSYYFYRKVPCSKQHHQQPRRVADRRRRVVCSTRVTWILLRLSPSGRAVWFGCSRRFRHLIYALRTDIINQRRIGATGCLHDRCRLPFLRLRVSGQRRQAYHQHAHHQYDYVLLHVFHFSKFINSLTH